MAGARWLAALQARGDQVELYMRRPALERLLRPLVARIRRTAPPVDLPRVDEATLVPPMPYLHAPSGRVPARLRVTGGRPRVAICWATDRSPVVRAPAPAWVVAAWGAAAVRAMAAGIPVRSTPLAAWAPVWRVPGLTVVSVQVGQRPPAGVADFGRRVRDYADTATVLAQVDLVVTVDTSVAHLGGALGVPTWVLLPASDDGHYWRRPAAAPDRTPWYPAVRFVQQRVSGEWGDVLGSVAAALAAIGSRRVA